MCTCVTGTLSLRTLHVYMYYGHIVCYGDIVSSNITVILNVMFLFELFCEFMNLSELVFFPVNFG